jgi:predicted GNAT family acetyltransferase
VRSSRIRTCTDSRCPSATVWAFVSYWLDGDRLVLVHTEVPPKYRGRNVASRLAQGMFEILRKTGRRAVLRCSYLVIWARRHPEYNDIIDG